MLLHLHPRLFSDFADVELVDLSIDPLRLKLRGGVDLMTRRPLPNKHYAVACRRQGRKAINGIFIDTDKPVTEFLYTARWAIHADFICTHKVHYQLLDAEFDAASDSMVLWYAYSQA